MATTHQQLASFIWQIADLLRGPYRPPQYERVILPMTVLRRFDCVLAPTKAKVLAEHERLQAKGLDDALIDKRLRTVAGQSFYNVSELTFEGLKDDSRHIDQHLQAYIDGFSPEAKRIFDSFDFTNEVEKMYEANILYLVISKFCDLDLHPSAVPHHEMGLIFEHLIRRFNEQANETAGDHFTPREVIRLMVDLLFEPDDDFLTTPGLVREILDPACGTGGMLAEAQDHLRRLNRDAKLYVYGQDFNPRAYAIAASAFLLRDTEASLTDDPAKHPSRHMTAIRKGDTLTDDQFAGRTFDYFLANPPFGVDWKKQRDVVEREHDAQGFDGRFGAGTPRVNDGSLLFLQHMIAKFQPYDPDDDEKLGSRLAIVFSGSPLFTGVAGSGESAIRRWIIENDWLEAIVALPEQMFYNTGIGTYVWVLSNRKVPERQGKIQLIDAREQWEPLDRSLGDKRRRMSRGDIAAVVRAYGAFETTPTSKIFDGADFGFTRVYVERPLRLRFRFTAPRMSHFLDAYPELLDDLRAFDATLGREPYTDYNAVWRRCQAVLKERGSSWRKRARTLFRDAFTEVDPDAAPVVAKRTRLKPGETVSQRERNEGWFTVRVDERPRAGQQMRFDLAGDGSAGDDAAGDGPRYKVQFESNTDLKDYEYVPLTDDVDRFFEAEVLPYVPDAWMDRSKDRTGYEINFTRHFYTYDPPRDLDAIDADLERLEAHIADLLQEVTT